MARGLRTIPRKTPRQSRAKATVEALLTAAARILVESGYEGANVNRIAEVAGVSIGSLYQYYPSKEALVAGVIRRQSELMIAAFEDNLFQTAELPIEGAIRDVVKRALAAYSIDPKLRCVIMEQVPRIELFERAASEFDERFRMILRGYFTFHAAKIRPKDHDLAARILMAAVEAVARRVCVDAPELLASQELLDEVTELVSRYVLKTP